ncbi:sulfite exporter TauE/SafE family protein [Devosia sp. PTR5]|uniref:Probable membrane transporter protein n=1 Tax=Devosia oryzisoli TaxID=2774138 RepID=A0A927FWE8_9HYPH|nr:sulfite exporter TauE/SafE family protein [Devosia oryzisoli]MBD8065889.1 sulfite exporter TauE/SafE family protein [Devosia oryzisoli]
MLKTPPWPICLLGCGISEVDWTNLVWLFLLAGLAAYIQTMTGFAFGLLMMAGIAMLNLIPLPDAAVVVGLLTLINAIQMLARGWRDVAWDQFRLIIGPSLMMLVGGYWLLEYLADTNLDGLRLLLGVVIIGASIQLSLRPHPRQHLSRPPSFVVAGALAGILGGMFSTAGPPLIYHMYRQPLPHAVVRQTLVLVFAINAVLRLVLVGVSGNWPGRAAAWALVAAPAVMVLTFAAKRWPPPLSPLAIRRVAFFLLLLTGVFLALPALLKLSGVSP